MPYHAMSYYQALVLNNSAKDASGHAGSCRVRIFQALAAHAFLLNLQDYILPIEYVNTMRDYMLDKCPVSSYKDIAAVIEEDLGRKPEELFASIEQVPIASASLAQVQILTACMHAFVIVLYHRYYSSLLLLFTQMSSPQVRHVQA